MPKVLICDYTKLKFLLKLVCPVFKYIGNYAFAMIKLQFRACKIYQLENPTVKIIIKYFACVITKVLFFKARNTKDYENVMV